MNYDVVLFGATGFTGKLVAEYLASHPNRTELLLGYRWTHSGEARCAAKLALAGAAPEIIVADTARQTIH